MYPTSVQLYTYPKEETEAWWEELGKVAPRIKEAMIMDGSLMIGYQPLHFKNYR